jgi:60 kDa SS-A/Ro ribonucleoprotein
MARTNTPASVAHAAALADAPRTYGGGFGSAGPDKRAALRRLVGANLLWEDQYYRKGDATVNDLVRAARAAGIVATVDMAREAVSLWKLRHVPLALTAVAADMARENRLPDGSYFGPSIRKLVPHVVTRADMVAELLAVYAKLNDIPVNKLKGRIPMALKRGLADAMSNFDRYQLSKWDREKAIRLRDVLFLTHPNPNRIGSRYKAETLKDIWAELASNTLGAADTWEVGLSAGGDKKEVFTRLLIEQKLGDQAFLMNLRNMIDSGVDRGLIADSMRDRKFARTLPFQFIAAAEAAPQIESHIDAAMLRALQQEPRLSGKTLLVVDVSGSMRGSMGGKSKLDRLDAASGLAILVAGQSDAVRVFVTAGSDPARQHKTGEIPARQGMALRSAIRESLDRMGGGGIFFTQCLEYIRGVAADDYERVIVITDEQDTDSVAERNPARAPKLAKHNYIFNVGAYDIGLNAKQHWDTVTGFSEAAVRYVAFAEQPTQ